MRSEFLLSYSQVSTETPFRNRKMHYGFASPARYIHCVVLSEQFKDHNVIGQSR